MGSFIHTIGTQKQFITYKRATHYFHADKYKKWLRILLKFSKAEVLQKGTRALSFTHLVPMEIITANIEHESQTESKNQIPTKNHGFSS